MLTPRNATGFVFDDHTIRIGDPVGTEYGTGELVDVDWDDVTGQFWKVLTPDGQMWWCDWITPVLEPVPSFADTKEAQQWLDQRPSHSS